MKFNGWVGSYRVDTFPWIDGKRIYFNVQYFAPGQSLGKPPVWDKTIYITNDVAGQQLVSQWKDSLVEYVANMQIKDKTEVTITVNQLPLSVDNKNSLYNDGNNPTRQQRKLPAKKEWAREL